MKLIAVLSIEEYEKELMKLFSKVHIPVFSELEMKGYKFDEHTEAGWFGHRRMAPQFSVMNIAFVNEEQAEALMAAIADFNAKKQKEGAGTNPVHAFQLGVEKMV